MRDEEGKVPEGLQTPIDNLPAHSQSQAPAVIVGLLFWVVIGTIVAWNTESGQSFLRNYWWSALAAFAVVVLFLMLPTINAKLTGLTAEARTGLIVFALLPIIGLLVAGIVLLEEPHRVVAMRLVFLAVVVLLPATMYYLFIVT